MTQTRQRNVKQPASSKPLPVARRLRSNNSKNGTTAAARIPAVATATKAVADPGMPASISTAKVAATTPTVLLDGGAMEATSAPAGGGARLDFAPSFRAHFIEQLESVRASLEDRKAEVCATIEGVKRELQAKSGYAMTTLPCTVRDTKVKDFNEQNGCNLVELLEAVAISVLAERAGEWKRLSEEIENQCPPTIIRGTGGARSTRSTASSVTTNPAGGAAASLSHLSDHASTFQTPTISRDMRQQGSIWSTNAKKKKATSAKTGKGSPNEAVLTVSTKKGAVLNTCGLTLEDLVDNPNMAAKLDAASVRNLEMLQRMTTTILGHHKMALETVQEEEEVES